MIINLNELPTGQHGVIKEANVSSTVKRRLLDLGMIEGTKIKLLYKSPFGDPKAYLIRGSVIALRDEDSKKIKIEFEDDKNGIN